jgi:hypothetical protein
VIEPLDITTEENLHLAPQQRMVQVLDSSSLRAWFHSLPALPYGSSCQMELRH